MDFFPQKNQLIDIRPALREKLRMNKGQELHFHKDDDRMSVSNRRMFIKSMMSAGGLIAVSDLPALEEDASTSVSRRGRFEKLNINMIHVDVGATKPFSVLHISDTHLTDAYPDEDRLKQKLKAVSTDKFGGQQESALRESVAWAKSRCDYLLHTGDVVDWHSRKNLDLMKKYVGSGVLGAVGNHEYTLYHFLTKEAGTRDSVPEIRKVLASYYSFKIEFNSRVINGVNFVSIDDTFGRVTPAQVKLFKSEVEKGLPIVLVKHVPFYTDYLWTAAVKYWSPTDEKYRSTAVPKFADCALVQRNDPVTRDFIAYLKTVKELKAILAGHEHFFAQDRFSPTAMEYLVGGNYLFCGQEVLFS